MDNDKPGTTERAVGAKDYDLPKDHDMPKASMFSDSATVRGADTSEAGAKSHLPVAEPFQALSTVAPNDRTGVFGQLVTDDSDIAGLVAYSIYKQNKLDWLTAFEAQKGRAPNADELASYIIGEGTPRRIATYRHLAEATLTGNGPAVGGTSGQGARGGVNFRRPGTIGDKGALTTTLIATYALIAILFLIGFLLAAHYTMSSR